MPPNQLLDNLFSIANDHSKAWHSRVEEMVPLLLAVESEKFKPDVEIWQNTDYNWNTFKMQSLIDREIELAFFGRFFQKIFHQYSFVESFSWNQRQDYNDNWYSFDLLELNINDHNLLYRAGFLYKKDDMLIHNAGEFFFPSDDFCYRFQASELGLHWEGPIDDLFWEKIDELELFDVYTIDGKAGAPFRKQFGPPAAVFLIFLQSLYRAYNVNYFIDLFGWSARIEINREGITRELAQRAPSNPLEVDSPKYKPTKPTKPWWKFWQT